MPVCKCCGQELPRTYKIGQKFRIHSDIFILASATSDSLILIDINGGTRYCDPVKYEGSFYQIHEKVLKYFIHSDIDLVE